VLQVLKVQQELELKALQVLKELQVLLLKVPQVLKELQVLKVLLVLKVLVPQLQLLTIQTII
jgi:hypothetical protein